MEKCLPTRTSSLNNPRKLICYVSTLVVNQSAHLLTVADVADRVEKRLASGLIDQPLCAQIRMLIGNFPQHPRHKKSLKSEDLDESGTRIWNLSTRMSREDAGNTTKVLPLLRAFALILLKEAFGYSSVKGRRKSEAIVRLLRTSLKAARSCVASNELDLATDILQSAADYAAFFQDDARILKSGEGGPLDTTARDLLVEYWLLRAMLSWKQDRLDLAETHFKHATGIDGAGFATIINISDLACEIGKDMLKRPDGRDCVPWFEEASKVLDRIPYDEMDTEAIELRQSIMRDLARALMLDKTEESFTRAADLIACLENEHGLKLGVLLLKIDLLTAADHIDPVQYHAVISQMIQKVVLSENTFKTILFHIHKLQGLSVSLARKSLQSLLLLPLFEYGDGSFIEKAVIMLIWTFSTQSFDPSELTSLKEALDTTCNATSTRFGAEATHAAQTLCWKAIEMAVKEHKLDAAESWCRLATHSLFDNAGESNKSKIARKLMIIALLDGKASIAREAFYQMPEFGRLAPSSQYLMFRVALYDGETGLADECLSRLVKSPDADAELLYACVQEAQQQNSRDYAYKAMQAILQRADLAELKSVKALTLIRCMMQMLLVKMENEKDNTTTLLTEACDLMKTAASTFAENEVVADPQKAELQWFAKTSYNTAIKHVSGPETTQALTLINLCLKFTGRLRETKDDNGKLEAERRLLTCHYLGATACAILARSDDQIDSSEQHYTALLKHTQVFSDLVTTLNGEESPIEDGADLTLRRSQMLRLEIEALFKLKQYDKLDNVFDDCTTDVDEDQLDMLADLIISMHSLMVEQRVSSKYLDKIPTVMQKIINKSWRYDKGNMVKLARWLRCIFRMTSGTSPDIALRILEQATSVATRSGLSRKESERYPAAELEWLASTAFNMAVDRFCASDAEGCRVWGEAALNLAKTATDSPGLSAQMQGLWMRLQAQQQTQTERGN
ncbi:hypothetical protein ANO11243_025430 [Dothideomycetidae sp. 11243]|nr:hypothetical protein ANO11243_025430 [fungal sp. No.11243]